MSTDGIALANYLCRQGCPSTVVPGIFSQRCLVAAKRRIPNSIAPRLRATSVEQTLMCYCFATDGTRPPRQKFRFETKSSGCKGSSARQSFDRKDTLIVQKLFGSKQVVVAQGLSEEYTLLGTSLPMHFSLLAYLAKTDSDPTISTAPSTTPITKGV